MILSAGPQTKDLERRVEEFLAEAVHFEFWKAHFKNHNFEFDPNKFNLNGYWESIPFLTKEDFLKIGFEYRLRDAHPDIKKDAYRFILRVTSGTTAQKEPILLIKKIGRSKLYETKARGKVVCLTDNFNFGLSEVLNNIFHNFVNGSAENQPLIISSFKLHPVMESVLDDFGAETIRAYPTAATKFSFVFKNLCLSGKFKRIILGGDFLSDLQLRLLGSNFKNPEIDSYYYSAAETGPIAYSCDSFRERYGENVYHLRRKSLIELVDVDKDGYGEIVVTKARPRSLALIRYRTGDMGRFVSEQCVCGKYGRLFLVGRKNSDFIKCAGVMVMRQTIERTLAPFKDYIAEWAGEVRERAVGQGILGELTLKIKPTRALLEKPGSFLSEMSRAISNKLFLTPTDTLAKLAKDNKFMPLKIELTENIGETQKRLPLRRIL
ncbi:MAG: hypothetical protein HY456_02090 [Parcubacteria group bacterium]|nr:hypothetical protein [Parcubacteria group bacterium]